PHPEEYDPRTLYERLQEQRQRKQDEHREATRLANLVHKINDDEYEFLSNLEVYQKQVEQARHEQEATELERYRQEIQAATTQTNTPGTDKNSRASLEQTLPSVGTVPSSTALPSANPTRERKREHPLDRLGSLVRVTKKVRKDEANSTSLSKPDPSKSESKATPPTELSSVTNFDSNKPGTLEQTTGLAGLLAAYDGVSDEDSSASDSD
ncbi:hypothetical protein IWQ61_010057, partial [Dispira simplex]